MKTNTEIVLVFDQEGLGVDDENGNELVYWDQQEWIRDPMVVLSIANAAGIIYLP